MPSLLIEARAQQVLAHPVDLGSLFRGGHRGQQSMDRVDCAVRVVRREPSLVCPTVANLNKFTNEGAVSFIENSAEDVSPLVSEHCQKKLDV
jgi:hypothetical protein